MWRLNRQGVGAVVEGEFRVSLGEVPAGGLEVPADGSVLHLLGVEEDLHEVEHQEQEASLVGGPHGQVVVVVVVVMARHGHLLAHYVRHP